MVQYEAQLEKMALDQELSFGQEELIGLIFPVALQSTFPNVWEFAEKLPQANGQNIFMVDTMESFSGGVVGPMKMLLKKKGFNCIGAKEIKMANSMQTSLHKVKQGLEKNTAAPETAKRFIETILDGTSAWHRIPILSDLMRCISASSTVQSRL